MGGIKNKLGKLSNKVKNLLNSLPLVGRADEMTKSSGGLTIPLSDYRLTSPFSQRRTKSSLPLAKGRQMSVVHRWGCITKYTSLACLTLAILSTLVLNIISSYSNSNTRSNAEQVGEVSTFANIDPTSISISISSYPSATGDTNDGNLSLSIPQGGGLVAGRHTVSVNAGSEIDSYSVFLNGGTNENGVDNTDLVNTMADSLSNTGSLTTSIPSLVWNGDLDNPANFSMYGNSWGVALPDSYPGLYNDKATYESLITNPAVSSSGPRYYFSGIPPLSVGQVDTGGTGNRIVGNKIDSTSTDIYYGVKVDDPSTMLAGDYTTNVVYTVIAELKTPSITSISPNPIRTGTTNKITLKGNNLSIVNKVTIDDRGTIRDCTNIAHSGTNNDTTLTCTLPAISNTGTYVITAETEGGQTATTQIQLIPPAPTISKISPTEINTNNSTTTLTITGNNLATTGSVYVDFNNNSSQDNGEACTVKAITNTQITCTVPSRSTAGGPYTVRLTTDGGSVSKANSVSYVTPVPTVTSVSPSIFYPWNTFETPSFTITGEDLSNVASISVRTEESPSVTSRDGYCEITSNTGSVISCTVDFEWWSIASSMVYFETTLSATFYNSSGVVIYYIDNFSVYRLA